MVTKDGIAHPSNIIDIINCFFYFTSGATVSCKDVKKALKHD